MCFFFVLFCFCVNITVFRVSVALPCIPITPLSIDTFLKVLKLRSLESLSAILEYRFAFQQAGCWILFFNQNNKYCFIHYSLRRGCTSEWRTNFQMEATTRDSKRGQSRNRGPENFVHPPFKISGSAPEPCWRSLAVKLLLRALKSTT